MDLPECLSAEGFAYLSMHEQTLLCDAGVLYWV